MTRAGRPGARRNEPPGKPCPVPGAIGRGPGGGVQPPGPRVIPRTGGRPRAETGVHSPYREGSADSKRRGQAARVATADPRPQRPPADPVQNLGDSMTALRPNLALPIIDNLCKSYRSTYNTFARHLGADSTDAALGELFAMSPDLAHDTVERFRDSELDKGLSENYVAMKISALRHAVDEARAAGITDPDLYIHVSRRRRPRVPDLGEVFAMFESFFTETSRSPGRGSPSECEHPHPDSVPSVMTALCQK